MCTETNCKSIEGRDHIWFSPSFSFPSFVQWLTHSKYSMKLKRQCMFQFTLIWRSCIDLKSSWDEKEAFRLFLTSVWWGTLSWKLPLPKLAGVMLASLLATVAEILKVLVCSHFCGWYQDDPPMVFPTGKCKSWLAAGIQYTLVLQTVHLWTKWKQN